MRSEAEIRARLEEVVSAEVTRRVELITERLPHKCTHNHRHPLDARKWAGGEINESYNRISTGRGLPVLQSVGLCMLGSESPEDWNGTICDEPIDAKRCPFFSPSTTKEDVLKELNAQLQDEAWVRENMPEAHGLLWVLGEMSLPKMSWWRRFLLRFVRPKLAPPDSPFDSQKLLSSGE